MAGGSDVGLRRGTWPCIGSRAVRAPGLTGAGQSRSGDRQNTGPSFTTVRSNGPIASNGRGSVNYLPAGSFLGSHELQTGYRVWRGRTAEPSEPLGPGQKRRHRRISTDLRHGRRRAASAGGNGRQELPVQRACRAECVRVVRDGHLASDQTPHPESGAALGAAGPLRAAAGEGPGDLRHVGHLPRGGCGRVELACAAPWCRVRSVRGWQDGRQGHLRPVQRGLRV